MHGRKLRPSFEERSLTFPPGLAFCKKKVSLVDRRTRIGRSKIISISLPLRCHLPPTTPPLHHPPPPLIAALTLPLLATTTPPLPSRHRRDLSLLSHSATSSIADAAAFETWLAIPFVVG